MEPKARIKSGLIAVALGLTTTFNPVGSLFSLGENLVSAQAPGQVPAAVVNQQAPYVPQTAQPNIGGYPAAQVPVVHTAYKPVMPTAPEQALAAPNPQQAYQIASQKLFQARKAIASKDLTLAERLATEVHGMNLAYPANSTETPASIFTMIQHARAIGEQQRNAPGAEQTRRNYAQFLLSQAGALLQYGEVDLATQLTREAQAQNVVFNQVELQAGMEPQAMFKRIEDVRRIRNQSVPQTVQPQPQQQALSQATQHELNQALSILGQARQAMNQGQLDRAEQLCRVAINKNLSESIYPQGADTPSRLLAQIAERRQNMPVTAQAAPQGAAPAVYHPGQDQTQNVQVRGNDQPMVAMNNNVPIVDQALRDRNAVLQRVTSEIMQQISNADQMCKMQRNPEAALDILKNARQKVEESHLDAATKASFIRTIDKATQDTVNYMQRFETQFALDRANEAVLKERQLEIEQFRTKEEKLKTLFLECNKLIEEQRYDEAVLVAKRAREFAPDEPATHLLLTSTQLVANHARTMQTKELKEAGYIATWQNLDATAIIDPNVIERGIGYGDGWEKLKKRRKGANDLLQGRRPETELEILRRLEMPVSISVDRPVPLEHILQLLRAQTGVNIFIDHNALAEVDVTTNTPISIQLMNEIKLKSVLKLILGQLNLAYVVKDEMLKITSVAQARGELYVEYHYVGDLIMNIPNFDGSHAHDFNRALDRGYRHAVRPTASNGMAGQFASNAQIDPQVFAATGNPNILAQQFGTHNQNGGFNGTTLGNGYNQPTMGAAGGGMADFSEIMELIESVVSPESWSAGGGDGEMTPYMPNLSLVVRQTEEVHSELVDLLSQLRKLNDLQIAVEVRYITLADEFYEKMGMDFQMKFMNKSASDRVEVMGGTASTTTNDNDSNSNNSNNSSSGSSNSNNSNSSSNMSTNTIVGGNNVTVGLTGPGAFSVDLSVPFSQNNYSLVDPSFGGFQADAGLQFGFALLSDIEAYFFMSATQGDTRSNVLQAPKVTIFNGQMASIQDTSSSPFVTSVIPVVGDFAAAYQPIIVILNEGQFMTVQGVVSNNRQYVRLTLNPVFSTISKINTFRYVGEDSATDSTETTAKGDDSSKASTDERTTKRNQTASASGVTLQLPTLASFTVQTTVSVPDGGTILLGGMKRLREGRTEAGTPILNKIPYINRLFMNTAIGRDTQSIMMMVTPRIIIQEEEEEYITGIAPSP